jgi:phosphinothricin acetyltransferase
VTLSFPELIVTDTILRPFTWRDVPAITGIYAHYVETSVATFDLEAPGEAAMAAKFGHMVELGHPLIVAEMAGQVVGYAYASTYRPRPAYRFTCEDTVYLAPEAVGQGLGKKLLSAVIAEARAFGFKQMIAVITAEGEASIALHEKLGFAHIGRHPGLGLKFERWLDVVHMQLAL